MDQGGRGRARVEKSLLGSCYKATWAHPRTTDGRIGPSRVAPTPQGNPTTNQSETSLVSDAPWTKEAEEGPKSSSPRAIRFLKRGGKSLAQRTQFKLCKNQRFDLPGPKTRFFSTRRPQNLHVVQSAQTRTRPLAIDMHVGERANTRSRDPGRTKLYCQSRKQRARLSSRLPAIPPRSHVR